MCKDLASLFADEQTNVIDWDGPLYSLYELPGDATELIIRFVSAKAYPPQGLRLKVRAGAFEIDGTPADDVILWQDSAPPEVHVRIKWKSTDGRALRIWNAWRVKDVTRHGSATQECVLPLRTRDRLTCGAVMVRATRTSTISLSR